MAINQETLSKSRAPLWAWDGTPRPSDTVRTERGDTLTVTRVTRDYIYATGIGGNRKWRRA